MTYDLALLLSVLYLMGGTATYFRYWTKGLIHKNKQAQMVAGSLIYLLWPIFLILYIALGDLMNEQEDQKFGYTMIQGKWQYGPYPSISKVVEHVEEDFVVSGPEKFKKNVVNHLEGSLFSDSDYAREYLYAIKTTAEKLLKEKLVMASGDPFDAYALNSYEKDKDDSRPEAKS